MSISLSSLVNPNQLTQGTAVTATGTAIDFTGIPSGVKQISVLFNGVATSGLQSVLVRLGSGSIETTGYISLAGAQNNGATSEYTSTTGIIVTGFVNSSSTRNNGIMCINNVSGNTWVASYAGSYYPIGTCESGGNKTLGGVLDSIRILTTGSDTFSAGTFNIIYQ